MKKVALLFSGQGSQYSGMGKNLLEKFNQSSFLFEEASDVLKRDMKKLCLESSSDILSLTENAQPAIFTISYILYQYFLKELNLYPAYMAGHSLGEYSALCCSNAFSFKEGLLMVSKRAQFMKKATELKKGLMAAVLGVKKYILEDICNIISKDTDHTVVLANYNSPDQIVISGSPTGITKAEKKIKEAGGKLFILKVSGAFHSPFMEPAADLLEEELKTYNFKAMSYPVISNVTAKPYSEEDDIVALLKKQLTAPVLWEDTLKYLKKNGVQRVIEIGPASVLKKLTFANLQYVKPYSLDEAEDLKVLKEETQKEKSKLPNIIGKALGIAVATQNQNWDNDQYQKGVIEPYQKMKEMASIVEKNESALSDEIIKEMIDNLLTIFNTKKLPVLNQVERINQLFYESYSLDLYNKFQAYILGKFLSEAILYDEMKRKLVFKKKIEIKAKP